MPIIRPKHDELFRKALENPIVAREFFEAHLPQRVRNKVDIATLKIEKESFIEEKLKTSISDVLFSVKFDGNDGYLYILTEHQSKPDHFMALRLLNYKIKIIERHRVLNPKTKHIPIICPIVFYNGIQKYNAPMNMWDLCKEDDRDLAKEIWSNDYCLVNVQEIPDEEFKQRAWSGIMEFFMKNIRRRNIMQLFDNIGSVLVEIAKGNSGEDYLRMIFYYTLTSIDENDIISLKQTLASHLNREEEDNVMVSIAQRWFEDGKMSGKLEGKLEGKMEAAEETAINMLRHNLDLPLISSITGLPISKIEHLSAISTSSQH